MDNNSMFLSIDIMFTALNTEYSQYKNDENKSLYNLVLIDYINYITLFERNSHNAYIDEFNCFKRNLLNFIDNLSQGELNSNTLDAYTMIEIASTIFQHSLYDISVLHNIPTNDLNEIMSLLNNVFASVVDKEIALISRYEIKRFREKYGINYKENRNTSKIINLFNK